MLQIWFDSVPRLQLLTRGEISSGWLTLAHRGGHRWLLSSVRLAANNNNSSESLGRISPSTLSRRSHSSWASFLIVSHCLNTKAIGPAKKQSGTCWIIEKRFSSVRKSVVEVSLIKRQLTADKRTFEEVRELARNDKLQAHYQQPKWHRCILCRWFALYDRAKVQQQRFSSSEESRLSGRNNFNEKRAVDCK